MTARHSSQHIHLPIVTVNCVQCLSPLTRIFYYFKKFIESERQHAINLTMLKEMIHPLPFNAFTMCNHHLCPVAKHFHHSKIGPTPHPLGSFSPFSLPQRPWWWAICFLSLWIRLFWIFYANEIIQYGTFVVSDFFHCPPLDFKFMTTVFVVFTNVFPVLRNTTWPKKKKIHHVAKNKHALNEWMDGWMDE